MSQIQATRPVSIAERIRRTRGLRQADVARAAGVSRSYVSLVEGGWRPPARHQEAIADALGVDAELLWPTVDEVSAEAT